MLLQTKTWVGTKITKTQLSQQERETASVILLLKIWFLKTIYHFTQTKTKCQAFDIKYRNKSIINERKMCTKGGLLLGKKSSFISSSNAYHDLLFKFYMKRYI